MGATVSYRPSLTAVPKPKNPSGPPAHFWPDWAQECNLTSAQELVPCGIFLILSGVHHPPGFCYPHDLCVQIPGLTLAGLPRRAHQWSLNSRESHLDGKGDLGSGPKPWPEQSWSVDPKGTVTLLLVLESGLGTFQLCYPHAVQFPEARCAL